MKNSCDIKEINLVYFIQSVTLCMQTVIERFKTNVTGLCSRSREIMLSIRSMATIAVFNAPHTKLVSAGIDRCLKTCGWNMTFDWMNTAVRVSGCQSSSAKQNHFMKNVS